MCSKDFSIIYKQFTYHEKASSINIDIDIDIDININNFIIQKVLL